jgi:hypothetical protein
MNKVRPCEFCDALGVIDWGEGHLEECNVCEGTAYIDDVCYCHAYEESECGCGYNWDREKECE